MSGLLERSRVVKDRVKSYQPQVLAEMMSDSKNNAGEPSTSYGQEAEIMYGFCCVHVCLKKLTCIFGTEIGRTCDHVIEMHLDGLHRAPRQTVQLPLIDTSMTERVAAQRIVKQAMLARKAEDFRENTEVGVAWMGAADGWLWPSQGFGAAAKVQCMFMNIRGRGGRPRVMAVFNAHAEWTWHLYDVPCSMRFAGIIAVQIFV